MVAEPERGAGLDRHLGDTVRSTATAATPGARRDRRRSTIGDACSRQVSAASASTSSIVQRPAERAAHPMRLASTVVAERGPQLDSMLVDRIALLDRERARRPQAVGSQLGIDRRDTVRTVTRDVQSEPPQLAARNRIAPIDVVLDARRVIISRSRPTLLDDRRRADRQRDPDGTSTSLSTTELAATTAHDRTIERCSTIAPLPTSASSSIVQPSRWTMWPITQRRRHAWVIRPWCGARSCPGCSSGHRSGSLRRRRAARRRARSSSRPDRDRPDDHRVGVDVGGGIDRRYLVAERVDGHARTYTATFTGTMVRSRSPWRYRGCTMSRRIDIELTSSLDDGTWTWRAAGARQPRGVLDGSILPGGAKVGDELKVEVEQEIDGITVLVSSAGREKQEPELLTCCRRARVPAGDRDARQTRAWRTPARDDGDRRAATVRDGRRRRADAATEPASDRSRADRRWPRPRRPPAPTAEGDRWPAADGAADGTRRTDAEIAKVPAATRAARPVVHAPARAPAAPQAEAAASRQDPPHRRARRPARRAAPDRRAGPAGHGRRAPAACARRTNARSPRASRRCPRRRS